MADLKADKDRADSRYRAARAIGKVLAELENEDVLPVIRHVAVEYGLTVHAEPAGGVAQRVTGLSEKPAPTPPKAA